VAVVDPQGDAVGEGEDHDYVDVLTASVERRKSRLTFRLQTNGDIPSSMPDPRTAVGVAIDLYFDDDARISLLASTTMAGWELNVDRDGEQSESKGTLQLEGSTLSISVPVRELGDAPFEEWVVSMVRITDAGLDSQTSTYDRAPDEGREPAA
jgi:hypothetical protein